ncbi:ABC transporter ATP-binding protein [Roseibacterium sp. SDUM158016]|uniref:ABC transporter ATP-binding protein n=1 Tax=Roseicyclus sediminis TaxID=2980997 RepID=UPI0021D337DC|nr:ABC transporter ATP-binding protein [Roseibacterium sp. SDUM158016]MCU4652109.1 ABC transporter ATP-binding protein [Roseibacterium sp. SDUM158016]
MMLDIQNLYVSYQGIKALRGVSLQVDRGEMVAIIGSNGAGKSTLLNAISRLVPAGEGRIVFNGVDLRRSIAHKVARLGVLQVPEGRQILGEMTVLENLQVGQLALGGRPAKYSLSDVYALFPVLEERHAQLGGTLSGGQQQMLAIGRAMMGAPEVLLLDEPSLGLSPLMTDQVFAALGRLNADGLTVMLVEQNAHRALELTSRAYVLDRGLVVREGKSRDLADDPSIIASYLGV